MLLLALQFFRSKEKSKKDSWARVSRKQNFEVSPANSISSLPVRVRLEGRKALERKPGTDSGERQGRKEIER
jgi:hypothetical protein